MKILLIVPRYNLTNKADFDYSFPLGLAYISAVMKKAKYEVECLNLNHLNGKVETLINSKLNSKHYSIVGTGGNALIYAELERILTTAQNHPSHPKTLLGGPIITSEPEVIFNALKPTIGVLGEAEETILELLKIMGKKNELKKVKGIIYSENNQIILNPRRNPPDNLDALPYPDFEGLEFEKILANMHTNHFYPANFCNNPRVYPLLASRSCPYQCTFCYHDGRYRKRSMENIMKEISENVKKYKINIILLFDECFALTKKEVIAFCTEIKKIQRSITWPLFWTAQLRVESIDFESLKMMYDSGCRAVSYGFESFSQKVLSSMNKNITPKQIDEAFKATLRAGIAIQANFIFGDVAETKETARETLNYYKKNGIGQIGLLFIQPYPTSKIYQHCLRKHIIKDKLSFIKNLSGDHWFNMTDGMSDEEVIELKKEILDSFGKYTKFVTPIKVERDSRGDYSLLAKCPFCHKTNLFKKCGIPNISSFGFFLICRHCGMRFFIVSSLQKLAYRYYRVFRTLRDLQLRILKSIKKKML